VNRELLDNATQTFQKLGAQVDLAAAIEVTDQLKSGLN
jgi:hypothetical protein